MEASLPVIIQDDRPAASDGEVAEPRSDQRTNDDQPLGSHSSDQAAQLEAVRPLAIDAELPERRNRLNISFQLRWPGIRNFTLHDSVWQQPRT